MKRMGMLLAVLVVLLGVVFVQRAQRSKVVASAPVQTLTVDPDRVSKLRIQRPEEATVQLSRVGGGWKVTEPFEYAAQDQIVQTVLRALETLELEDVVSSNPEKRGTFQVDSTGTEVEVWEGDQSVMALVVGKSSPDFGHTYVRLTGENDVYRAVGVLSYNFNKKPDDWRDKTILKLDRDAIAEVKLEYPKEKTTITLAKVDTLWTYSANGGSAAAADSATVDRLLRSAAQLNTVNFASEEETSELDFGAPDFRLTVETDAGSHKVDFIKGEASQYYAKQEGNDAVVFSVYEHGISNLQKKADDFKGATS